MNIKIWDSMNCQVNTCYPTLKLLKCPNTENLLDVILNAISCMNERKIFMLSMDGKEKQKAKKRKKRKHYSTSS